jgi:purine-cytosine permease-like protein
MPFAALLVPSLSIEKAAAATLLASAFAAALIAAVAGLAAREGLGSVQLFGRLFGERGPQFMAALLLARNVIFAVLALSLMGDSAALVSERAGGVALRPVWLAGFAVLGLALASLGPRFVAALLARAGVWLILLLAAGITASAFLEYGIPAYLQRPAAGGWPEFGQALHLMLIVPLLWLPLVPDLTVSRRPVPAAAGAFAGVFVFSAWFGILGVVYLPAVGSGDLPGFVVGMQLGIAALVLIMLLQLDEVFANAHSALRSLSGLGLTGSGRLATLAVGTAALIAALPPGVLGWEGSFLLLGSIFVPLAGVLIAQELLPRSSAASSAWAVVSWAGGWAAYQWVTPSGAAWWIDALQLLLAGRLGLPFPLGEEFPWLPAAVISLLVAFCLQAAGRFAGVLALGRPEVQEKRPAA